MEAVVGGCFTSGVANDDNADDRGSSFGDRLIIVDGGSFGHRFTELASFHGISSKAVKLAFGEQLTPEMLKASVADDKCDALNASEDSNAQNTSMASKINNAGNAGFTGLLVNIHETSTGQLYDMGTLASFCREHGLYFVCDAIGSFLADPIDFAKDGIDALIVSSQKALALPPGLAAVVMSDRLYRKIVEQDIRPFSVYFDFREAEKNAVRGQTPFTPAVGTILALRERLERLEAEGGAQSSVACVKALAEDFRLRIKGLIGKGAITIPAYPLSNACTPLVFPNGGAMALYKELSQKYGFWLNPNGGELADKVLRVGHLGDLVTEDNEQLVELLYGIL